MALALILVLGAASDRPCDIYGRANTPCVAAHSTVRALYSDYSGALYQLKRSDGETRDVAVNAAGYADAAAQDSFCTSSSCVMQRIYDQSPMANHLDPAPASTAKYGRHDRCPRQFPATPVDAMKHTVVLNLTHKVYGAWFEECDGYRNDLTRGIPTGNDEETIYMVALTLLTLTLATLTLATLTLATLTLATLTVIVTVSSKLTLTPILR